MGRVMKVIQNGVETLMPNNQANILRLQHFNHINRHASNPHELLYTIIDEVTEEEERNFLPQRRKNTGKGTVGNSTEERLRRMEQENSDLKTLLLKFMATQTVPQPSETETPEEAEIKKKPGRPPKIITDGENQ